MQLIRGWKQLGEYLSHHPRTLQAWHYERAKFPLIKTHPTSTRSRWFLTPELVEHWLKGINTSLQQFRELSKYSHNK